MGWIVLAAWIGLGLWLRGQRPTWRGPWWGISLLALATTAFFWQQLSGVAYTPADGGDLASFLYPIYAFAQRVLHSGHLPLWNPHLYLGAPHVADVQAGWLYPPTLLTLLVTSTVSYRHLELLSIGHFFWAGAGMFFLLRRLLARPDAADAAGSVAWWAALAGSLAFMFSDPLLTHFGNYNLLATASWLPWVLWAFGRRSDGRAALLAGLFLGFAALAGHPQTILTMALALAVLTVVDIYSTPAPRLASALGMSGRLLFTLGLAFLLAAPVLLPAALHTPFTQRAAFSYGEASQYSLSPAQWIGLVVPAFFGRGPQLHWGPWDRVEVGYLGILPLALALLAVLLHPNRRAWRWLTLAGVGMALALGFYSLPHGWLTLLPGFAQLRAPARLLLLTDLGLAVLAAYGLQGLLDAWDERAAAAVAQVWRLLKGATAAVLAIGLPLSYLALLLTQDREQTVFIRVAVTTIGVATLAALLLATLAIFHGRRAVWARPATLGALACLLILLDLGSPGAYLDSSLKNPTSAYQQPEIVEFLRQQPGAWRLDARTDIDQLWLPNTALVAGLDDIWGIVNPLVLADVARYWEGIGAAGRSSPLYDFLNAQFVVARKDVTLDWDKFERVFDSPGELAVFRNRRALPRASVAQDAIVVNDQDAAWQAIHAADFDPSRQVVVEGGEALRGGVGAAAAVTTVANGLDVDVQTRAPAYLVISQPFYPGWQATDQAGRALTIRRANYAFQAVAISADTTIVHLRFRPASWAWGLILSAAGLLSVLAGLWRRVSVKTTPPRYVTPAA
ncbi:hypothetical protein [Candidatus Amarolinea aalborgensis]|uniref:hypothetical protein n=1 Tax=Candidatus Amarolinea aalborgensis TaxID=2249329 RepID=UPI003BF95ABB